MPELVLRRPHNAQEDTVTQIAVLGADAACALARPRLYRQARPDEESSVSPWILKTYPLVESSTSFGELPLDPPLFLSGRQVEFLRQVREDLGDQWESHARAAALCIRFSLDTGLELASGAGVRTAVFADDEEALTLVAHNRALKRQLSFEFRPDGSMGLLKIDEQMKITRQEVELRHVQTIRAAIAWFNSRS